MKMIDNFLADKEAWDAYITGPAGTGKTTALAHITRDLTIPYIVCAYTHKACDVLRSKGISNVQTLHSFLQKRPTLNQDATSIANIDSNSAASTSEKPAVLFIDEYSMIGEKDFIDIRALQDSDYTATPSMKVVWIGDQHQLPPVKDQPSVIPEGKYQVTLRKIYRNDNPLQTPLNALISYIERVAPPAPLIPEPGFFERDHDILAKYSTSPTSSKVLLAYTNQRVQELNDLIANGRDYTEIFCPTNQHHYTVDSWLTSPTYIDCRDETLHLNSKYKTLEYLIESGMCRFVGVHDQDGNYFQLAVTPGHYEYKVQRDNLQQAAVQANRDIKASNPRAWAQANPKTTLARKRAKAWRDLLSFNDYVHCIDHPYAMTVHKSQGSTFEEVYLDIRNLSLCKDYDQYLRLAYVAISRASKFCFCN